MGERGMFPETLTTTAADVLVTIWNEARHRREPAPRARTRAGGLRVDVYPEADKLGKQFKYAAALGVPFVVDSGRR